MSIKLKGSTDGSVTLQAPADTSPTGTDKTLILPTGVGSAGQVLKNGSTAGTLEFANGGKILQVQSTVKTNRTSASNFTFVDALTVNITPSSTSSNILVYAFLHLGSTSSYALYVRLRRDSTDISGALGDGDGLRPAVTSNITPYENDSGARQYQLHPTTIVYYDTAVSTTSQVTYRAQIASYQGSVTYLNRSYAFQNTAEYDGTPISTLTVMEVEG